MKRDLAERRVREEVELCLADSSLEEAQVKVEQQGARVLVRFESGRDGRSGVFALDCTNFDAQPPSVSMLDPVTGEELPLERWTPGVPHSIHPVTRKPFVCIQGVAEYHSHPSHVDDSWDRYRLRFRIPQTVKRLLEKAGVFG